MGFGVDCDKRGAKCGEVIVRVLLGGVRAEMCVLPSAGRGCLLLLRFLMFNFKRLKEEIWTEYAFWWSAHVRTEKKGRRVRPQLLSVFALLQIDGRNVGKLCLWVSFCYITPSDMCASTSVMRSSVCCCVVGTHKD